MATLHTLLATSLSASQDSLILSNASHTIGLLQSGSLLEEADEQTLHKFKSRVSAMIKSKSPISRWFGAYLAKVSCETNFSVVKGHGGTWAGLLIHLLEIPVEPHVTHEITIEALSTIFSQTWGKQELTRDITTPRLPQYIKLLLKLAEGRSSKEGSNEKFVSPLLSVILPALNKVMKQQSTTFKPHVQRYQRLLLSIISTSYMESHRVEESVLTQACEGYVLLHFATVKGNEFIVWRQSLIKVINKIHATVSQFALPIVEEDSSFFQDKTDIEDLEITSLPADASMILVKDKLRVLFVLLGTFFTTGTKTEIKLPIGAIVNLADRLFSLNKHTMQKRGVEQATRNLFLAVLDDLHIATCTLLLTLIPVVRTMILVHIEVFMHHIDVLSDSADTKLLENILKLASILFGLIGVLPKAMVPLVSKLVQAGLKLVQPRIDASSVNLPDAVANPSLFLVNPKTETISTVTSFFSTVIVTVPDLSLPVRSQIDQWLILAAAKPFSQNRQPIQNTLALSAFFPGKASKYSILPIALRSVPKSTLLESMVHPRLPPTSSAVHNLTKSAVLIPSKQKDTIELKEESNTSTFTKRKLQATEDDSGEVSENNGFVTKRAKSYEAMEVEISETPTPAPANLELSFETTTVTITEVKETIEEGTTSYSVQSPSHENNPVSIATPEAPVAALFTMPPKKPSSPTAKAPEAKNEVESIDEDDNDDDDDEDLEMPEITLESSDEEEEES